MKMSSSSSSSSSSSFHSALQSRMDHVKEMSEEEKLYRYKGVLYPTALCPEEHLKALDEMEAREDDVLLVAYPKCGFNWMIRVMRRIIDESTGIKSESKTPPLMEFTAPDSMKLMDESPSPRLLGTHLHPDNIPRSFTEKKTKMLVVFRNPKDTLVSFYHFTNNNPLLPTAPSWENFYCNFMSGDVPWGSYFDHAVSWEEKMSDPHVLVVTYEELKQNLSDNIRHIAEFFGFHLTEVQVQKISEQSSFSAMKEHAVQAHNNNTNNNNNNNNNQRHNMAEVIFRKGEVGDWKNHFTPEQNQHMDQLFEERLGGTRLGARINYQLHCQ